MVSIASASKKILRGQIKLTLGRMTTEERARQSKIIAAKVLGSDFYKKAERVCIYLSMDEEVSTKEILFDLFNSGKQCYVPRYTDIKMEMLKIESLEEYYKLPKTKWNIKQPMTSEGYDEAMSSGGLDLILVPGLAFTTEGKRLGRGKGYYDSYIDTSMPENGRPFVTVGLAFKEQMLDYIPTDDYDVEVDQVIYPDD